MPSCWTFTGLLLLLAIRTGAADADSFAVNIRVDASRQQGELKPIWRFFGADEPNYTTAPNGRKLLGELGELEPKQVFFRTHNLLTSGDGTPALKWGSTGAYKEDTQGRPVYDWTILDQIFDACLERGVRPYVEIGFMPKDLSTRPEPYQHHWTPAARYEEIYTGWAYPPKDYNRWAQLVGEWARHCLDKYGRAEVESWFWEVWNEPNIAYWRGTPQEFHKLHDYAIDAVRRALPSAKVGGPDVAGDGGNFTRAFFEHCLHGTNYATGRIGTPLDFVSFHAKGAPRFIDGHVQMGIAAQLKTIQQGFNIINSFPELRGKPIIIGESDPEGCAACQGPQLSYRNGTMYASYTAAVFARKHDLAQQCGANLEGALTWAFEFEDQPLFAGFRSLASNGIDKPVLNVFRMFSQMRGRRLAVESDNGVPLETIVQSGVRNRPDVSGLASMDDRRAWVLLWHYHDDDVPGPDAVVSVTLAGFPANSGDLNIEEFRIDQDHSNAFVAWQRLGSPKSLTPEQYAELARAGQLSAMGPSQRMALSSAAPVVHLTLPRQGVSLLALNW